MPFSQEALDAALARAVAAGARARFVVAFSGGLDSTVVLYGLAGSPVAENVRAVHVDHGLHPDSTHWRDHCRAVCLDLGVEYTDARVPARAARGQSPEEAARDARYGHLREEAAAGETVVTGHHADDQLETILLQLFRGAGPAGLAGMPELTRFDRGWLCRPLLGFRRADLMAWAQGRELAWLEDPSNLERGYDRNFLRHEVIPEVNRRWPSAALSAARSARHCADAADLLEAMGDTDLGVIAAAGRPAVSALAALSVSRQRNVLRRWLARSGLVAPDATRMESILRDVIGAREDARPEVIWDGGAVRRYRGRLYAIDPETLKVLTRTPRQLCWPATEPLSLGPGLGRLRMLPEAGSAAPSAWPAGRDLEVRFRAGGEAIRPAGRGCTRPLKKLLQEAGIPPWWRGHIPLIWHGDRLLWVADLWRSEEVSRGELAGWCVAWEDRPDFT